MILTSSIAVYGAGQTPMTEDVTPQPEDPYGISKYAVELDLRAAHEMFGLDYTVFRPHNVYGERQNIADRYRNVIGIFMNNVLRDAPLPIFGDGRQTRAFFHIDDVAPIIARSSLVEDARNEVFNIGADTPYTILELVEEIARAFDVEPRVETTRRVMRSCTPIPTTRRSAACSPRPHRSSWPPVSPAWPTPSGPRARRSRPSPGRHEVEEKLPPSWAATFRR